MPIHYESDLDHVVVITIDRPETRNACDMEHFKLLREAWERFAGDDQAWVAIVTGVGEAFFSGADLKRYVPEITKFQAEIAEKGLTEIDGYRLDDGTRAVLRNWPLYKPVIAAVNGFCTAGGMEMLGGCDLRVACPEAKFAVMEPKRGLFAGGGTTVRLPRQIPWPQAMEFLLCADLVPAAARVRDGAVERDRSAGERARHGARVRGAGSSRTLRSRCRRPSRARCRACTSTRISPSSCAPRSASFGPPLPAAPTRTRPPRSSNSSPRICGRRSRRSRSSRARSSGPKTRRKGPGPSPRSDPRCGNRDECASGPAGAVHHRRRGAYLAPGRGGGTGRPRTARHVGRGRARGGGRRGPGRAARDAREHPDGVLPDVAVRRPGGAARGAAGSRAAASPLLGDRRHHDPDVGERDGRADAPR